MLIVGISFYVMATSLTTLVSDYLFAQRIRSDRTNVEQLAVQIAPYAQDTQIKALYDRISEAGSQLEGRLLFLDAHGKVQADSFSELNGLRLQYPEVLNILEGGATSDYGMHRVPDEEGDTVLSGGPLSFLLPGNVKGTWVIYCAAAVLSAKGETLGVLLLSSPIADMLQGLYDLQYQMILYFLGVALIVLIIALVFSNVITRPIATLTRGIARMGRGDLSARVPVKGSGEMRRMADTFNTMSEKLEALDQSRNQFVSNASHELKTPLATMKIMLENLIYQPEMPPELRTEFMTDINKEIDRLNLIIGDLLTLVQMDTQNMKLNRENIVLAQIVEDTLHRIGPMAEMRKQTLTEEMIDEGEMYADGAKLQQVIYNIVDNAVKYTPEGGHIHVSLRKLGRDIFLSVADDGPGIPKEDQPHIFDRFYRVDKARSRDTGGTGLGLSIVRQIVMLHGGVVTVESEPGKGSTFVVELPAHKG